jgi:hypothetical protein
MAQTFDLLDIFEKDEVEELYKRSLSDEEWEQICFNLRDRYWSKVRADIKQAIIDAPDYFLRKR